MTLIKQHWMSVCAPTLCALMTLSLLVFLITVGLPYVHVPFAYAIAHPLHRYALNIVMVPTLVVALVRLLRWHYAFIGIDGGIVAWRVSISDERRVPTWTIREARVQRSLLGALFDYGDVIIDTGIRIDCIPCVPRATTFAAWVLQTR